jgi:tetratricopeptide (TPR) repeat protein
VTSTDGSAYTAARELLRYRNHPQRLRTNAIVRSWWTATQAGDAKHADDHELLSLLNRRLRDLVSGMPRRHSELLRRCDLEGEAHRSVMRGLALSERHFYRERRAAILALGQLFKRQTTQPRPEVSVGRERFSLGLARADALERAGQTDDALGVLLALRTGSPDDQTIFVDVRLAEVNRDAGRFAAAAQHARFARDSASGNRDATAELDGLSATIAWQSGDVASLSSDTIGARLDRLRANNGRRTALIPHALSDALEVSAESTLEAGDWTRALALFEEGYAALPRVPAPRNDVQIRSLIWIATARSWIAGGLHSAAQELDRAYALACAQSLPREGALALGRLCQLYDLTGNTRRALELATTQLEPVASGLVGDWRAAAHLDIASIFVSAKMLGAARDQLAMARAHAPHGSFAYAAALMQECEIDLASRNTSDAIAHATTAIREMERLGRSRHVGVTLAVRAEALWMSGNRREGANQMHDALDLMARRAHPLRLAAQYGRAMQVTGVRQHGKLARELWGSYEARLN